VRWQQLRADPLLERRDLLGDRRARLAEHLRRRGEAARVDDAREQDHLLDGEHRGGLDRRPGRRDE
jgi:hypothetical protein